MVHYDYTIDDKKNKLHLLADEEFEADWVDSLESSITGLNFVTWIYPGAQFNLSGPPRIKFTKDRYTKKKEDFIVILIDNIIYVEPGCLISENTSLKLVKWVILNKTLILNHWYNFLCTFEMRAKIKRI